MKRLIFLLLTPAMGMFGQTPKVDIYTAQELHSLGDKLMKKQSQFAAQDLEKYGNHYTMVAERGQTGSSELHQHEADILIMESGEAMILTGGKIVNPRTTKPGEIRGSSITGGQQHHVGAGDVIHLPAGTPHQMLVEKNKPIVYFVIKVKDQ